MQNKLIVGQVLWLKIRYQKEKISNIKHPLLIAKINKKTIELIAIDKIKGQLYNLYYPFNKYISCTNPIEKVISKDSYAQLNNKILVEYFEDLKKYRKTLKTLSKNKLKELLKDYFEYQKNTIIKEERKVYINKYELKKLNR